MKEKLLTIQLNEPERNERREKRKKKAGRFPLSRQHRQSNMLFEFEIYPSFRERVLIS